MGYSVSERICPNLEIPLKVHKNNLKVGGIVADR